EFIESVRSGPHGVSLAEVAHLAERAKLHYQLVFRDRNQPIPVPSIIHWKVKHFAAIIEESGGRFLIQDPTFGTDLWITRGAVDAEGSGYFLVPSAAATQGWRTVNLAEAAQIRGMGFTTAQQMGANTPTEVKAHENSSNCGVCGYNITMLSVGVNLNDTP